jgi:hypothetical protein
LGESRRATFRYTVPGVAGVVVHPELTAINPGWEEFLAVSGLKRVRHSTVSAKVFIAFAFPQLRRPFVG